MSCTPPKSGDKIQPFRFSLDTLASMNEQSERNSTKVGMPQRVTVLEPNAFAHWLASQPVEVWGGYESFSK